MNELLPGLGENRAVADRQAELLEEAIGATRNSGCSAFEIRQPGRVLDQPQAFLARAQHLLGQLALGNVEVCADAGRSLPGGIALPLGTAVDPADFSVVG